jgi:hypothetical protein
VHEFHVGGPDEHRHDRHPTGGQDLGFVGVERGRRHEVVMEPIEPVGEVVEERALDLDHAGEFADEPFRIVARVGVRALGEEDPDERSGALALGRRRERGGCELIGGEAGLGGAAEHLGHDPREGLGAAPLGWSLRDVRPGAVSTGDVAGIGQPSIDRPDRVGVHPQCRTKLADGRKSRAGQEPTGVDLVCQLPVDLGRDGDVGIALDIERPARRPTHGPRSAIIA